MCNIFARIGHEVFENEDEDDFVKYMSKNFYYLNKMEVLLK